METLDTGSIDFFSNIIGWFVTFVTDNLTNPFLIMVMILAVVIFVGAIGWFLIAIMSRR
jgi:hypothetical protein